ncbi:MAG: GNAT family N-acetyltransferase [Flavobacteriales bacterium]|nr:GNAT family N-acetyltransferase [Flavobacteriales bacterium]
MIVSETERLIIRHWNVDDIANYATIVSDPDVMQFIGHGAPQTYKDAESYVQKCMDNIAENGWARFAVQLKHSKELIGFCGFAHYNNELDFGWRYAKKFWGNGYGTEAAKAVLELGIEKFNFPRIVCIVYQENIGSIKIIEKIGMTFEKNILLNGRTAKQYVKLNQGV